jgi:hypothetical protein
MADKTLRNTLLYTVKRHGVVCTIQRFAFRTIRRYSLDVARRTLRLLKAQILCGFFSGLRLFVRNREIIGRVILAGKDLAALPEPSLTRETGCNQNGRQPWPVFWIKIPDARLERIRETTEIHLQNARYYFSSPPGISGCTNPYAAGWLREKSYLTPVK